MSKIPVRSTMARWLVTIAYHLDSVELLRLRLWELDDSPARAAAAIASAHRTIAEHERQGGFRPRHEHDADGDSCTRND